MKPNAAKLSIQENIRLAPFTSFNIGGPAKYFCEVQVPDDINQAIQFAQAQSLPVFVLGGGTNLLISDRGFAGLVIKLAFNNLAINGRTARCGSGVALQRLIDECIEHSLAGLELMSGIGGTVGGAVRGNAGAFGQTIGDRVVWVSAWQDDQVRKYTRAECAFNYRDSQFKKSQAIIIETEFELMVGDKSALRASADQTIAKRNSRYNVSWQCAGCVFKNIDLKNVKINKAKVLKALDVSEAEFDQVTKFGKLPVSFITDRLGLKGQVLGGAKIADEHGAFILNTGTATSDDVVMLMSVIKTKVRNALGIQLEPEIELVGF